MLSKMLHFIVNLFRGHRDRARLNSIVMSVSKECEELIERKRKFVGR